MKGAPVAIDAVLWQCFSAPNHFLSSLFMHAGALIAFVNPHAKTD